jgi:predicted nucleic acid-binding protein
MDAIALDTTFLIDLQHDRLARRKATGALEFLGSHPDAELLLPVVALGEYLQGFEDPASPQATRFVGRLDVLEVTTEVARAYASTTRQLRLEGKLIGGNDLWIGCTAREAGLPILTRDVEHFSRIPSLRIVEYAGR